MPPCDKSLHGFIVASIIFVIFGMYLFSRMRHVKGVIHKVRLGPFNNYVMLARVGGVHHFVTSIVKYIVMNNRLVLQKDGWGYKNSKFSIT